MSEQPKLNPDTKSELTQAALRRDIEHRKQQEVLENMKRAEVEHSGLKSNLSKAIHERENEKAKKAIEERDQSNPAVKSALDEIKKKNEGE